MRLPGEQPTEHDEREPLLKNIVVPLSANPSTFECWTDPICFLKGTKGNPVGQIQHVVPGRKDEGDADPHLLVSRV